MTDFDDDRPMRPVSARRVAEQRWRLTEPWRVKEKHRKWRNIGITLALIAGLALYLNLSSSTTALAPSDVLAVGEANGQLQVHYEACRGEGLEWVAVYPSEPTISRYPFQGNAIWLLQAIGSPVAGNQQFPLGTAPSGFHNLVDFQGLSSYPADHEYWIEAVTSARLVRFAFSKTLLDGNFVVAPTGRFAATTYSSEAAAACR